MKTRWARCVLLGIAGAVILLGGTYLGMTTFRKPKLYPLKEVLWLYDGDLKYYPPTSQFVINYCNKLRDSGIDVDTPSQEPYVLMRTDIKDEMDDIEPVMILNWDPKTFDPKLLKKGNL